MSLHERIIHLENMMERWGRDRDDAERVDPERAHHITEAIWDLQVLIARLKKRATDNVGQTDRDDLSVSVAE